MSADLRAARRAAARVAAMRRVAADLGTTTAAEVAVNTVRDTLRRTADGRASRCWEVRDPGRLLAVEPVTELREDRAGRRRRAVVGAECHFTRAQLEVRFIADDVVRVSWGPDEPPLPWALTTEAGGLLDDPEGSAPGAAGLAGGLVPVRSVKVSGDSGALVESTSMALHVAPDGSVSYARAEGPVIRTELPPLRRGPVRTHRHLLRPGERVSGLGAQAGEVALRGTHRLWNRDPGRWGPGVDPLYTVIPVLVGVHPDGDVLAFYENSHRGVVRIADPIGVGTGRVELEFSGGMLRHYVTVGDLPHLLDRYSALTGRPPLPPRWALGYHQSRWGYRTEEDVRAVADGFRDEGLPLSVVHLDIDYMDGYRVFTVDRSRFSDLGELADELGERGTNLVTIVDPAVKVDQGYDVYLDGRGHFVRAADGSELHGVVWPGTAAFPDFTDPATRRWWGGWYGRLADAGVAGVWHDMNEPTSIALWGDQTLPADARHVAEGRGADHGECHNVYGLLMDRAGAAALRRARPGRRPFVLSRSGWAGLQRWAWHWTGDSETSWASLRQQVATVVGLGLSGVAYTGSDIGGFTGTPTPELYTRWLEMSVFMPLCRTHCSSSAGRREPWAFPEPYRSAIGRLVRFRYRLLPYLYTLAAEASTSGHPLVRPPFWEAGSGRTERRRRGAGTAAIAGTNAWPRDCFLLGDRLLVAPVVWEGASSRRVDLPPGTWLRWRPLGDGAVPEVPCDPVAPAEGGSVQVDAPLGEPPVFVRSGSIVPLDDARYDEARLTHGHEPKMPAFHCFPDLSGRAAGTCYDDEGDGSGPHRLDRLELVPGAGGLRTLSWRREGDWPAPRSARVVVHGKAPVSVDADGTALEFAVVRSGTAVATVVDCPPFEVLRLS